MLEFISLIFLLVYIKCFHNLVEVPKNLGFFFMPG